MSDQRKLVTRGRKACTACRQVKLRCDSMQTFPAACSRCKQNGINCQTDPTFKRVRTRHRLEEFTSQLNAIQKTLGILPSTSSPSAGTPSNQSLSPPDETTNRPNVSFSISNDLLETVYTNPQEKLFFRCLSNIDFPPVAPVIGNVSIDNSQVKMLFKQFGEHHYRHCPVLNVELSIDELYQSSSFLFWTIVVIASQCHESHNELHTSLLRPYRQLLGEILVGPLLSIEPIQGLILLCKWPLPVAKQKEDPSWNYSGLLINAAIQLGLHKTSCGVDNPMCLVKEARRRTKTWVAILQVSSRYVWYSGHSLSPELLNGPLQTLDPPLTPSESDFLTKYKIQRQSIKSAIFMCNLKEAPESFPVAQILLEDLEDIKRISSVSWGPECEVIFLGAQLSIYGFHLQQFPAQSHAEFANSDIQSSRKVLIQSGFSVAVRIIHIFSEMTRPQQSPQSTLSSKDVNAEQLQKSLPKHYFITLVFAITFIFKIVASTPESSLLGNDIARNHIHLAHEILSTLSMHPMDEASRAATMIKVLSGAQGLSGLRLHEVRSGGRLRLGIMEDVISTAKVIREENSFVNPDSGSGSAAHQQISDLQIAEDHQMRFSEAAEPSEWDNLDMLLGGSNSFGWNGQWELDLLGSEPQDASPGTDSF
ncbi:Zn2/Cys6 DNA-binding protein [Glarea lozoyensis ATCC 20868]|uniref:Zn2/Cys6 DNA-binding protein n=1 Tax=Glarea lozoyensis (strain ATCC 20868 / MF5171) TaxID=1116229 RepID=S3DN97_GLAL2|nr:Zn2/Cys6 DNA-binding protein [Glarea lozoyensis ATCC 20868]EPE33571.1 Zn2/Cys6 DNA-binding protein [Glarea lozoyensis ATCC 20868]